MPCGQLAGEKQYGERSAREQIAADTLALLSSHRAPCRLHGGGAQNEHRRVEPQDWGFADRMPVRDPMYGAMPMAHADEIRRDEQPEQRSDYCEEYPQGGGSR